MEITEAIVCWPIDLSVSVATGSGHPDNGQSGGHVYMPDMDQNYLVITCIENGHERSILSNRAVTNI